MELRAQTANAGMAPCETAPTCSAEQAKNRTRANMPVKNMRLKVARLEAGLSQVELADAVGATRQTIGLIEAGGYNPTLKLCVAICKTLGRTLDDLFWEVGENL